MLLLRVLFVAGVSILISAWYLEQVDNSECYYDLDKTYKTRKVCSDELPLRQIVKHIPPRIAGR